MKREDLVHGKKMILVQTDRISLARRLGFRNNLLDPSLPLSPSQIFTAVSLDEDQTLLTQLEDLIGRSMKGYVTPIPEFTQAVQEQIQQNMDPFFKNIYSPLKRKERNNRIQTLRKSLESSSTRKIEDEEFRQKLVEASRSDSREYLLTENTEACSVKAKERLRW
jgi:hypothetical protein